MRHIIVEGPDGSGKSHLIERLKTALSLEMKPRAVTSTGGPIDGLDLAKWVEDDVRSLAGMTRPMLYDRHPVISEPIYGRIARNDIRPSFNREGWLASQRLAMYSRVVVVWCLPADPRVVAANVAANVGDQMPGVMENIFRLYQAYAEAHTQWGSLKYRWDYTRGSVEVLIMQLKEAIR